MKFKVLNNVVPSIGSSVLVKNVETLLPWFLHLAHAGWLVADLAEEARWILSCYLPKKWIEKSPFGDENTKYSVKIEYSKGFITGELNTPVSPSSIDIIPMSALIAMSEEYESQEDRYEEMYQPIATVHRDPEPEYEDLHNEEFHNFCRIAQSRHKALLDQGHDYSRAYFLLYDECPPRFVEFKPLLNWALDSWNESECEVCSWAWEF